MTELINPPVAPAYDPDTTGWVPPEDDTPPRPRPRGARIRCGYYLHPHTGERTWGDHRVSFPGTTCREVACYVSHFRGVAPGWAEPVDAAADGYTFYSRPGVTAIAGALWGWTGGRRLPAGLNEELAVHAAHVVLDALRDAGYTLVPPRPAPGEASTPDGEPR